VSKKKTGGFFGGEQRTHEIRDPVHVFIKLESPERQILNSSAFQRLREVHQLAMTYLVYPGATHKRFEHSLGVMELATRIYDTVTANENIRHDSVRSIVPRQGSFDHQYWRRVLRMAALCHDMGHLPFSHAAEEELLPNGTRHEHLSLNLVLCPEMEPLWGDLNIGAHHVAKLAVGPKHYPELLDDWEAILSEMIIGDAFGADRMDYLLRDSLHAGVNYGRFDHFRLLDTLRILPRGQDGSTEPALGIEYGGLQAAESLLWARYFMYTQLYFHPVRRIYDIHLKDFLQAWLPGGKYSLDLSDHLKITDSEVLVALRNAAADPAAAGHDPACRITQRNHFRLIYEKNVADQKRNLRGIDLVTAALEAKFGSHSIRRDTYAQKSTGISFPVLSNDGRIQVSATVSPTLSNVPTFQVDYVFADPAITDEAVRWLSENRDTLLAEEPPAEE
jgi:HD superfamily phosphohydrolase